MTTPLRHRLIEAAAACGRLGFNKALAGSLSVRFDGGFLITPFGIPPEKLLPHDLVFMDFEGNVEGDHHPSNEWRFHRDILESRPEVGAVVHTHAPFATTLACLELDIPAFHYRVAAAGAKDIRCAAYATVGSQDLSYSAMRALEGRRACLLSHHGMIALGRDTESAMALTIEVEELAELYWRALQVGKPSLLSDGEMDAVLRKFEGYAQK